MSADNLATNLRESEYLHGLAEEDLQQLAGAAQLVEFAEGAVIFREGDSAEKSYLIVSGSVSLEICTPGIGCRRISTIGKGQLLGWSPVVDNVQLSATARAITDVTMIGLPKDAVRALCEQSPRFGYLFMKGIAKVLARRLTATRMQLLDVFGNEGRD